jgi:hypothetical protein
VWNAGEASYLYRWDFQNLAKYRAVVPEATVVAVSDLRLASHSAWPSASSAADSGDAGEWRARRRSDDHTDYMQVQKREWPLVDDAARPVALARANGAEGPVGVEGVW